MKVRYYGDPDVESWHNHMLRLLRTIHNEHGIAVEIERVEERYGSITDFPGDVRQTTAQEVYEHDLTNNRALINAINQRPSQAYKRSGTLDVAGNVAIVDDEGTV